ncbi:unnamed protein product [Brassica oleracea]
MIKLLLRQSTLIHRLQMFRDQFSEGSLYSMSGFDEVTTTSKSVICKRNLSDAYMLLLINICRKDSLTMGET